MTTKLDEIREQVNSRQYYAGNNQTDLEHLLSEIEQLEDESQCYLATRDDAWKELSEKDKLIDDLTRKLDIAREALEIFTDYGDEAPEQVIWDSFIGPAQTALTQIQGTRGDGDAVE